MSSIDERIVSMQFDNKDFQSNAQDTLNALEKLDKSLKFKDAAKGFSTITKAAAGVSLAGIQNGVDTINSRFTLLGITALNVMNDISRTAINAGKRLVDAFTIEPIRTGFQEYETQINAVQTILANTASKGTTLRQVNDALDELNVYADKTIYNFTEMTRNIGTFTAAGLDLKTSTSAIQGIANVAAVSGANAQSASRAMYQLSQALSSGTLKLMDWNSVVNASMGGMVLQDALKATSRECVILAQKINAMSAEEQAAYQKAHAYTDDQMKSVKEYAFNVDQLIEKHGSFRESLTEGWITSDVLARTFNKFTKSGAVEYLSELTDISESSIKKLQVLGDKTGYDTKEFEKMALSVAGSDEALAKTLTDTLKMASTAEDAATKVKTFTQLMDTLKEAAQSGWTQSWEYIIGDFEEAKEIYTAISNEIGGIIDRSSQHRNAIIAEWKQFGGRDAIIGSIGNAWSALLAVIEPVRMAMKTVFPSATGLQLAELSKKLETFTSKLKISDETSDKLFRTFRGLLSVFRLAGNAVGSFIKTFMPSVSPLKDMASALLDVSANAGDYLRKLYNDISLNDKFGKTFSNLKARIVGFGPELKAVGESLASMSKDLISMVGIKFDGSFLDKFKELASGFSLKDTAIKAFTSGLEKLHTALRKLVSSLDSAKESVHNFASNFKIGNLSGITSFFGAIKDATAGLRSSAGQALKDLGAGFKALFDNFDINKAFTLAKSGLLTGILYNLFSFSQGLKKNKAGTKGLGDTIKDFKTTIVKAISEFDVGPMVDKVKSALEPLGDIFSDFQNKIKASALKEIAVSIAILAGSLFVLSAIPTDKMGSALTAMTASFGELAGFLMVLDKYMNNLDGGDMIKLGTGLILVAVSLGVLTTSIIRLSSIPYNDMINGLLAVAGLLTGLVIVAEQMQKHTDSFIKASVGLIGIGVAVKILSSTVKGLSNMSFDQLLTGFTGLVGILAAIAIFLRAGDFASLGIKAGAGLILVAAAIKILESSIKSLGEPDTAVIEQGLTSVILLLVTLAGVSKLLSGSKGLITAGIGMIAVAAAMKILASAVSSFANMPYKSMDAGLTTFIVSLLALTAAVYLMPPTLPLIGVGLLIVAAALNVMATALDKMGEISNVPAALIALGVSLAALAVSLNLMIVAIPGAIALSIASVALIALAGALKIISTIPIGSLAKSVLGLAASLSVLTVFGAVIGTLVVPMLLASVAITTISASIIVLSAALAAIGSLSVGTVAKGLFAIAASFTVLGVAGAILGVVSPLILAAGVALITLGAGASLIGVGLSLAATALAAFAVAVVSSLTTIVESIPVIIDAISQSGVAIVNLIKNFIISICNAIIEGAPAISQAAVVLVTSLVGAIATGVPQLVSLGLEFILSLLQGINANIGQIASTAISVITNFVTGISSGIGDLVNAGILLMTNFINGMADGIRANSEIVLSAVGNLISAIIEFALTGLQQLVSAIPVIGGEMNSALEAAKGKVRETLAPESMKEITSSAMDGAKAGIDEKAPELQMTGENSANGLINAFSSKSSELFGIGTTIPTDISTGALTNSGILSATGTQLDSEMMAALQSGDFTSVGVEIPNELAAGMQGSGVDFSAVMGDMALQGANAASETSGEYNAAGTTDANSFTTALGNGKGKSQAAGKAVASAGSSGARTQYGSFVSAGNYMGDGLVIGIRSKVQSAAAAGAAIGVAALNAAKAAVKSSSPSKKFIQLGEDDGEGLVIGLNKSEDKVYGAGWSLSESALNAVVAGTRAIASIIEDAVETNPEITPVFNLSKLQNGGKTISQMLHGSSMSINAGVTGLLNAINDSTNVNKQYDDSNVIEAISDLRTSVNDLGNKFQRMQWVWDTGVAAGQLVDPINRELGKRISFAR